MPEFGMFDDLESSQSEAVAKEAAAHAALDNAIYDVTKKFGPYLGAATSSAEFKERVAYAKPDILKTVMAHLDPLPGIMRKVVASQKPDFTGGNKRAASRKKVSTQSGGRWEPYDQTRYNEDTGETTPITGEAYNHPGIWEDLPEHQVSVEPHPDGGYTWGGDTMAGGGDENLEDMEYSGWAATPEEAKQQAQDWIHGEHESYLSDPHGYGPEDDDSFRGEDRFSSKRTKRAQTPDGGQLIPEDNWDGYRDGIDQNGPAKVQDNFSGDVNSQVGPNFAGDVNPEAGDNFGGDNHLDDKRSARRRQASGFYGFQDWVEQKEGDSLDQFDTESQIGLAHQYHQETGDPSTAKWLKNIYNVDLKQARKRRAFDERFPPEDEFAPETAPEVAPEQAAPEETTCSGEFVAWYEQTFGRPLDAADDHCEVIEAVDEYSQGDENLAIQIITELNDSGLFEVVPEVSDEASGPVDEAPVELEDDLEEEANDEFFGEPEPVEEVVVEEAPVEEDDDDENPFNRNSRKRPRRQANTRGRRPFGSRTSSIHRVAGWDWNQKLNGFVSQGGLSKFACSCGEKVAAPAYVNCKCGKIWNSYPIQSTAKEANTTTYICREIPVREGVILAGKRPRRTATHSAPDKSGWEEPLEDDMDGHRNNATPGWMLKVTPEEDGSHQWSVNKKGQDPDGDDNETYDFGSSSSLNRAKQDAQRALKREKGRQASRRTAGGYGRGPSNPQWVEDNGMHTFVDYKNDFAPRAQLYQDGRSGEWNALTFDGDHENSDGGEGPFRSVDEARNWVEQDHRRKTSRRRVTADLLAGHELEAGMVVEQNGKALQVTEVKSYIGTDGVPFVKVTLTGPEGDSFTSDYPGTQSDPPQFNLVPATSQDIGMGPDPQGPVGPAGAPINDPGMGGAPMAPPMGDVPPPPGAGGPMDGPPVEDGPPLMDGPPAEGGPIPEEDPRLARRARRIVKKTHVLKTADLFSDYDYWTRQSGVDPATSLLDYDASHHLTQEEYNALEQYVGQFGGGSQLGAQEEEAPEIQSFSAKRRK